MAPRLALLIVCLALATACRPSPESSLARLRTEGFIGRPLSSITSEKGEPQFEEHAVPLMRPGASVPVRGGSLVGYFPGAPTDLGWNLGTPYSGKAYVTRPGTAYEVDYYYGIGDTCVAHRHVRYFASEQDMDADERALAEERGAWGGPTSSSEDGTRRTRAYVYAGDGVRQQVSYTKGRVLQNDYNDRYTVMYDGLYYSRTDFTADPSRVSVAY